VGAFKSTYDLHYKQFVLLAFPKGIGFKNVDGVHPCKVLPVSLARCFSIDDSSTTEIDDCISVQILDANNPHIVRVGVHIAAPTSVIEYDSGFDLLARERMSTLYMPGDKITMLPEPVIAQFSLDEGRQVCAASLYLDFDLVQKVMIENSFQSCLENICVAANLRHDKIEQYMTQELLESSDASAMPSTDGEDSQVALGFSFLQELKTLWLVTHILSAERDKVRGKPEARNRADFNFKVDQSTGRVEINERQRNSPLDRIVAEMMILANNQWGKFLAGHLTPAIYRSQQMGRVKMTTYPQPHQGLGVTHYGWFTSPLRRYSDMVNQRQLLAVLQQQAPVFAQNDARLHAAIAAFDARYASYNEFQSRMEKFWCLRWVAQYIEQHGVSSFAAVVVKPGLVRFKQIPLYTLLTLGADIAAGQTIEVEVLAIDEIDLEVQLRFVRLLDIQEEVVDASDESFEPTVQSPDPGSTAIGAPIQ
jgi:exoribonuclease II